MKNLALYALLAAAVLLAVVLLNRRQADRTERARLVEAAKADFKQPFDSVYVKGDTLRFYHGGVLKGSAVTTHGK